MTRAALRQRSWNTHWKPLEADDAAQERSNGPIMVMGVVTALLLFSLLPAGGLRRVAQRSASAHHRLAIAW